MGASFNNDINVVDDQNSTNVLLGAFDTFTGVFVDVTGYSSVTLTTKSDVASVFSGINIDWSTDGVAVDLATQSFTFDPAIGLDGLTVHATVRGRFYRIRYNNWFTPQTTFHLQALLRKGTPAGTVRSIDPTNTFITNLDTQIVQGILSMVGRANPQQVMLPVADDVNLPNDGPFVFVSPRPGKTDNVFKKVVTASLSPAAMNSTAFTFERFTFLSITNNVKRGNLYLQLQNGTDLSPTHFDYMIPAGHTWEDPGQFGTVYPGEIWGVWDEVYIHSPALQEGNARTVGHYYG